MACRGAARVRHPLACLLPLALCNLQVRGRSVEVGFRVVGWEQKQPLSTAPMPGRPQGGRGAPGAEDNGMTHHGLEAGRQLVRLLQSEAAEAGGPQGRPLAQPPSWRQFPAFGSWLLT